MTEILHSPSHFPSPTSSSPTPCASNHNDSSNEHVLITTPRTHILNISEEEEEEEQEEEDRKLRVREGDSTNNNNNNQLSALALFVTAFRKSLIGCSLVTTSASGCGAGGGGNKGLCKMEIGLPSDVRHVAHVTFDRFDGFLGLPVEFEPEVPRRAPSASTTVFGVSTDSMQLSYDSRGNSIPTILLQMQRHLYAQGGLQAEGIFRINADNGQEEHVRDQLNRGVIPEGVDVHCLAGLIKAWFRELPTGVLDSLAPEQVQQAQSEEECAQLVRLLPPMEAALLDWAVNLMADVAQLEHLNKMNARNVAMVFAPNMTKMDDPLTALMYAVQVMNFLKTLIVKTLREREDSIIEPLPPANVDHPDDSGNESNSMPLRAEAAQGIEEEKFTVVQEPADTSCSAMSELTSESESQCLLTSIENIIPGGRHSLIEKCPCEVVSQVSSLKNEVREGGSSSPNGSLQRNLSDIKVKQSVNSNQKGSKKIKERAGGVTAGSSDKNEGKSIVGRLSSRSDLVDAWR